MMLKICRYICVVIFSAWCIDCASAVANDSIKRGEIYASRSDAQKALSQKSTQPFFGGLSVGVDLVGPVMKMAASWNQLEAMGRVNLLETYFPTFEIGIGETDYVDDSSFISYEVKAPYWRLGCDFNFAKNKTTGNRIFGGFRYGFSVYDYSISAPNVVDPNWGTLVPFELKDLHGKKHWAELVFGLEAKMWGMVHLGWNFRYKFGLSEKYSHYGKPWYVPGYGENKSGTLGATFNLIFDLNL